MLFESVVVVVVVVVDGIGGGFKGLTVPSSSRSLGGSGANLP